MDRHAPSGECATGPQNVAGSGRTDFAVEGVERQRCSSTLASEGKGARCSSTLDSQGEGARCSFVLASEGECARGSSTVPSGPTPRGRATSALASGLQARSQASHFDGARLAPRRVCHPCNPQPGRDRPMEESATRPFLHDSRDSLQCGSCDDALDVDCDNARQLDRGRHSVAQACARRHRARRPAPRGNLRRRGRQIWLSRPIHMIDAWAADNHGRASIPHVVCVVGWRAGPSGSTHREAPSVATGSGCGAVRSVIGTQHVQFEDSLTT